MKSVKIYAEIGFRMVSGNQTPYNRAVSCIMKQAIVGEYPTLYDTSDSQFLGTI